MPGEQFKRDLLTPDERGLFRNTIDVYKDPSFARMYLEKWRDDLPKKQLDAFSQLVGLRGKVLDAGCGPGHHSHFFHKRGHQAVGIDLSGEELKLAEVNFRGPGFVLANMLEIPFTAGAFVGIWACASVMHLPKVLLRPLLGEFNRILAPGGVVALTITVEKESHVDVFGRFFELYSRDYLVEQIRDAGFQLDTMEERLRSKTTQPGARQAEWTTMTALKP